MKKSLHGFLTVGFIGLLFIAPALSARADMSDPKGPDNSQVNAPDQSAGSVTADQAKDNVNDRETMRKIRRAVVADKTLSVYAHNVKIISIGGKVTLKGPVHTADEKAAIGQKAADVVGADNVTNDITVKGS